MTRRRSIFQQLPKLLLFMLFLVGGLTQAYSQKPKLQKDGKYKPKKHKVADHHERMMQKKKNHSVTWTHHNKVENQTFSKKKKKKLKQPK